MKGKIVMFYDRLQGLCLNNGATITALFKEITGSSGNLSTWKKGNINPDALIKICAKFRISADYLLTGQEYNKEDIPAKTSEIKIRDSPSSPCHKPQTTNALTEDEADLIAMYRTLNAPMRQDAYDNIHTKYKRQTGEEQSLFSTYSKKKEVDREVANEISPDPDRLKGAV